MPTPTDTSERIAATVSAALREAGITQATAVEKTGIAKATLERRLTGKSPFLTTELELIADMLGVDFFTLMRRVRDAA